jgi:hypothetical protein
MDIVEALKQEQAKLMGQLTAIQTALSALNGGGTTAAIVSPGHTSSTNGRGGKRTLSAAGRANIVRATKARWAKIRAERSKGKKAK